jgi:putative flippase GtrA
VIRTASANVAVPAGRREASGAPPNSAQACIAFVIPAYKPGPVLPDLVRRLAARDLGPVVVVDDGSGPSYRDLFESLCAIRSTVVLRHAINLGKGAALKTAFNHVLCEHGESTGVVTVDADGQHCVEDAETVAHALADHPEKLVLGSRAFDVRVPWRSRIGNTLTRTAYRALVGQKLQDTQTGLRGIPLSLLPQLLRVASNRYEFELDMLLLARSRQVPVREVPIRTIYEDGNRSSHFNPLFDSMRIYFVLLRFGTVSLLTALLDNVVFAVALGTIGSIVSAQIVGRLAAVAFNYTVVRKHVFLSTEEHVRALPKYLLLVAASGVVSYVILTALVDAFAIGVLPAKIAAETLLFMVNFLVQRDLVFRKRQTATATDWDRYYRTVPPTAKLTRRYTTRALLSAIERHARPQQRPRMRIVELGGANSCFAEDMLEAWPSVTYHVVDSNRFGIDLFRTRFAGDPRCSAEHGDVLRLAGAEPGGRRFDLVYSVGLVEHFDVTGTAAVVRAHFTLAAPLGTVVMSFPTPTLLYRSTRRALEVAGLWRFPDERPLQLREVLEAVPEGWHPVDGRVLWPLVLTQQLIVFRRTA